MNPIAVLSYPQRYNRIWEKTDNYGESEQLSQTVLLYVTNHCCCRNQVARLLREKHQALDKQNGSDKKKKNRYVIMYQSPQIFTLM